MPMNSFSECYAHNNNIHIDESICMTIYTAIRLSISALRLLAGLELGNLPLYALIQPRLQLWPIPERE